MTTTEQDTQPLIALSGHAVAPVAELSAQEGDPDLGLRVAVRAGS